MSNVAEALKAEIARVSRKEVRGEIQALRKATAIYRRDIAALKKRVQQLERGSKKVVRAAPQRQPAAVADERQLRFSLTGFAAQRKKLALSAADFARLLGVSALSVYKWEGGQTRPRRAQLEAIAGLRGLGKREAEARLEQIAGS